MQKKHTQQKHKLSNLRSSWYLNLGAFSHVRIFPIYETINMEGAVSYAFGVITSRSVQHQPRPAAISRLLAGE